MNATTWKPLFALLAVVVFGFMGEHLWLTPVDRYLKDAKSEIRPESLPSLLDAREPRRAGDAAPEMRKAGEVARAATPRRPLAAPTTRPEGEVAAPARDVNPVVAAETRRAPLQPLSAVERVRAKRHVDRASEGEQRGAPG